MNHSSGVVIAPFEPADARAFAALNRAWLVGQDLIEPADEKQLRDPDTHIFATGRCRGMCRIARWTST